MEGYCEGSHICISLGPDVQPSHVPEYFHVGLNKVFQEIACSLEQGIPGVYLLAVNNVFQTILTQS